MHDKDRSLTELRFITIIALAIIIIGVIFYHTIEHLSWIDAIYFCVVTLATVGYGDIVPKTTFGKVFTIFYILIGIGIVAYFANTLIKRAISRRIKRFEKKT